MSQRTGFTGSAFIRLLARLADIDVRDAQPATAERLSQWLGWTDAISLSAALNGSPVAAPFGARVPASAEEGECARVRAALANAMAEDGGSAAGSGRGRSRASAPQVPADAPAVAPVDYAPYRQRYLARQQAMDAAIGALRARLRSALAARSSDMARLAAVDVVMEQALGAREHNLLATVPALLGAHFERLRQADRAQAGSETETEDATEDAGGPWLTLFRKDFHAVLSAELDFRFQPVEGLLDALRQETTRIA